MCGRYVTVSSIQAVEQRFNVQAPTPWTPQGGKWVPMVRIFQLADAGAADARGMEGSGQTLTRLRRI